MNLNIDKTGNKQRQIANILVVTIPTVLVVTMLPEIALAAKFDIDAGINAAFNPLIKAVEDHWPKVVSISTVSGGLIGEGDAKQRVVRAGIGAVLSGALMLGILALPR